MYNDPGELLEKYRAGKCSDKEKAIVESWYLELQSGKEAPSQTVIKRTKQEVWTALSVPKTGLPKLVTLHHGLLKASAWAAALLIIGSAGILYFNNPGKPEQITELSKKQDIGPGGNKAYLTLADGRRISLTDAANGALVKQKGLVINKTADGQLVYTVASSDRENKKDEQLFNTIETPKGGKYQINLPDGTRVWLNAASSLRYPTKFSGSTRTVELTGEGYFEVSKQLRKEGRSADQPASRIPFIVKCGTQEVQVLGTHFNINSYRDEGSVTTTLLEGRVRVVRAVADRPSESPEAVVLKPGEQSQLATNGIKVEQVDTESIIAWKQGDFIFDGEDLKSIMRKVARWYDVEVSYKGEFEKVKFGGVISRSKNISSVLEIMESTGKIHFAVEGRRITVLPNANN